MNFTYILKWGINNNEIIRNRYVERCSPINIIQGTLIHKLNFPRKLQSFSEIIKTTAKNGVVPVSISNVKLF